VFERGAGHDQAQLIRLGRLADIGDCAPELVHGHVEIVHGDHDVMKQPIKHLLEAWIAFIVVKPSGLRGELHDGGFVDQIGRHWRSPFDETQLLRDLSIIVVDG
jgi:hypothetical protein